MKSNLIIYILVGVALFAAVTAAVIERVSRSEDQAGVVACTMDAKQCPDGTYVSRIPPDCEFAACPAAPDIPEDVAAQIDAKANFIQVEQPVPGTAVTSPLLVSGQARGTWFFEGDFPLVLTNWDGEIIAEGFASADGEWMTEDFVPFTGTLTFATPDTSVSASGTLIFQKDNPSGLPEHDDALEIPVQFTE